MAEVTLLYCPIQMPSPSFAPRTLELRDGSRLEVRPIVPEDEPLLHETLAAMSERSVYFRFFSPLKRLPDAVAHRLAVVDYKDRFAVVAATNRPGGKARILGVARYDRAPETAVAEVAVAVVDEFQRRGLGGALLSILANVARDNGIKTFTLVVLPENREMLGLLRKIGWIHHAKLSGGLYDITFDIPEAAR
jgi:RimJ/RimL family protein N-acetyltransferase